MDPVPPHEPEKFQGIVRQLHESDLTEVMQVLLQGVIDSETQEPIRYEIEEILSKMQRSFEADAREYLAAVDKTGKVVGVVGRQSPDERMLKFTKTSKPAELINLFVLKNNRGQRAGQALVAELEKKSKEKGFTEMVVNSGLRYEKNLGFYDSLPGYKRVGISVGHYGPGRDAPVWRKVLR